VALTARAVPESLGWLRESDAGRRWLASLPHLVQECAQRWSLRVGPPYPDSHVSLAAPAHQEDGDDVILKIQFPHRESLHEAAALAAWNGNGAIRVLAVDDDRRALLLEQCRPGYHLSELSGDDALGVIIGLLPRLWVPAAAPFRKLADEAAQWAEELPTWWERAGRPFEITLLEAALAVLEVLPESQGEQVLLDQDLHPDNVLRATREPWLVIDPKPLVGERELGLACVIRSAGLGHSAALVEQRLDRLTTELTLDRERARGWALVHALAWSFENDTVLPRHVETARWLRALA
jgi:streptomycin 6-kinase